MSTVPRRVPPPARAVRRRARPRRWVPLSGGLALVLLALLLRQTTGIWSSATSSEQSAGRSSRQALVAPTPSAARPLPTGGSPTPSGPAPADARPLLPGYARLLRVPVISQLPALPNGCEATSLAMLLASAGIPADKMVLAREQKTNPAQPVFRAGYKNDLTRIQSWGDPNQGFVGNVYGRYGYGIYHGPLFQLLKAKAGDRAQDLTGSTFSSLVDRVDKGQAVLIWVTTTLRPTTSWVTWQTPTGPFRATFKEHAVVLVGHTRDRLIINNPLSGRQETVSPSLLIAAWKQLGQQALTIT